MKTIKLSILCLLAFSFQGTLSKTNTNRISFPVPTIHQEATSIWRTINDIQFFEKQGYKVHLPKHPQIDSLIIKSKKGEFGNDDYPTIYSLVETTFYNEKNYTKAIEKVNADKALINSLISSIDTSRTDWDWKFKMFDQYKIVFTLYGTGGSYDSDRGTITLFTNKEGEFMNYKSPANTIIHEITHMGMEGEIVQKYRLSHGLKERIVDTFVYLLFKDQLPEYRIQNMGNPKIDNYLKTKEDIASLNKILSEFTH